MAHYYTYCKTTGPGKCVSTVSTNLRGIIEFDPDLSYNTLLNWFSRRRMTFWEDPYENTVIIKSFNLKKGKQRVVRKKMGHNRNI